MNTPRVAGITVGTLFLCQMLVGIYINFSLLQPLTGEPGFLHTAPPVASPSALPPLRR